MKTIISYVAVLLLLCGSVTSFAATPLTFSYQGYLKDDSPVLSLSNFSTVISECAVADCSTRTDTNLCLYGVIYSIGISNDGLPTILTYELSDGLIRILKCKNSACSDTASIAVIDSIGNSFYNHPSMAIGLDGLPVLPTSIT